MTKSLDLGCGRNPKNPFGAAELFGVDIRSINDNIRQADLSLEPIPFDSDTFDFVTAHDMIEHMPRSLSIFDVEQQKNVTIFPFVRLMNEIYRVLKLGGAFYSRTPAFPHPEAFQDPTHVNIITEKTFPMYFNDHYPVANMYGFVGGFQMVSQTWDQCYLITTMVKSPAPDLSKFGHHQT
jgi:SAM-dependent methyltransferase